VNKIKGVCATEQIVFDKRFRFDFILRQRFVCLFDNEMKVREKEIDRVRIEQQEKRTACSFDLLNNQLENTCINLIFYLKMICLVFLIII